MRAGTSNTIVKPVVLMVYLNLKIA
ncbi:MAG: hypothetical protein, partial [Olavius algarvensis Gamma 1 endosymbiont]